MSKRASLFLIILLFTGSPYSPLGVAQDLAPTIGVPRLVRFSGTVKDGQSKLRSGPVTLTFSIYSDQDGGDPLWSETQTLNVSPDGRYEVLLGGETNGGLPLDIFGDPAKDIGQAQGRWLGIQVGGEPEQRPRVMLVSVPYALKAADAERLGGKSASE
ncbi:MAG TPA: hypothetical protein VFD30_21950, partial [Terriglobia bacterium]|nr:hypothetical protein [Terriglobia bacterium]